MPQIDILAVERLHPRMVVALGEPKKQALYFDVAAGDEKRVEPPRTKVAQALHKNIGLMERLALRNLVQQFEDGALR